jgi:hypothetical protein
MESNNNPKENQQIEKKPSVEMNNKNKLYNFLNKRKITSENKDTQDQLESSINLKLLVVIPFFVEPSNILHF